MKVKPLAFDSIGVRSQATLVEAGDYTILIDPGVALGPRRYGVPPTNEEFRALELARERIIKACSKADVVVVTHYHYDHHPFPRDDEMYDACFTGKIVLAKDIRNNINYSGRRRGKFFEGRVRDIAESLLWFDGKYVELKGVGIKASPAVWHGEVGSKVGTVIMILVEEEETGERFLFGSDAQNLADPAALEWAVKADPDIAFIDGFPTIFLGWRMKRESFDKSLRNLARFISDTKVKRIVVDHHIVRDIDYMEKMRDVYELARKIGKRVETAAEYMGLNGFFLEAWRKDIRHGVRKVNVDDYYSKLPIV
ncbi:MAG: MBL fold metallo-hydrolase [Desulfurococcales archaeon]|nr:MBL fold metallo-hydrolase [Desulfurococcales archaeon]